VPARRSGIRKSSDIANRAPARGRVREIQSASSRGCKVPACTRACHAEDKRVSPRGDTIASGIRGDHVNP